MDRPLAGGSALALRLRPRAPARAARARRALRGLRRLLAAHRRARIALIVALVCAPPLGAGFMWLRHSSLVAVEHVRITGVSGPQAGEIRATLARAAHGMSTLDVSTARLRAAVARFPLVRDVRASASVPHGLRITVSEQQPVAALVAAGQRTAVAADGVVLGPALLSGKLPTLSLGSAPAPGRALPAGWARDALELLGAAPAALARAAARVYTGSKGISISFRSGLVAYFGDSARAHAKWLALALVTSGERASGASYVDVRVPERPAAGFPSGVAPPPANASGESSASESLSASESSASIAAALRLAGGEGSATAAGEGRGSGEASNGSGESSSERSSGESGEASGTAGEAREAPRSQAGEGAEAGH